MTHEQFFKKVITLASNDTEMVEVANAYLSALAKKSAKAKAKRAEQAASNEPILNGIIDYLTAHKSALASDLAQACNISTSKATAMASKLIESGAVSVRKVKIPKVGERNAYSLVKSEPASNEAE